MKSSSALLVIFLILFLAGCGGAIYYFFFYNKDVVPSSGGGSLSSGGGSSSPTAPVITSVLTFNLTSSPTPICPMNSILVYNPALSSQITLNGVTVPLTTISTTSTLITANVSITGTTYAFSLNAQLGSATIGTNMFTLGTVPSSSSSSSSSSLQSPPTQLSGYNHILNAGVDGFDLNTGGANDITTCINNCNNINGCAGVQINDNTGVCSLKGAISGTSSDFSNTDYYFKYTNKALNFVIKNKSTGYFMCIENGTTDSTTGLPGSYCDFSEGRLVNAVTLTSSSVIPAKAIWTYKGGSNFVNVLSGAYMYVDMTGAGSLKITYDAQKAQKMTYKNGKIQFSTNGIMYSLQNAQIGAVSITATPSSTNPTNSDWDIIYLPQQKNEINQDRLLSAEVFFNIKLNGQYLQGSSEILTSSSSIPAFNVKLVDDPINSPNTFFSFSLEASKMPVNTLVLRTNPKYTIKVIPPTAPNICNGKGSNIILTVFGTPGDYVRIYPLAILVAGVPLSGVNVNYNEVGTENEKGYMAFINTASGACVYTDSNFLCMGLPVGLNSNLTTQAIGNADGSVSNQVATVQIVPINNCTIGDLPTTSLYF